MQFAAATACIRESALSEGRAGEERGERTNERSKAKQQQQRRVEWRERGESLCSAALGLGPPCYLSLPLLRLVGWFSLHSLSLLLFLPFSFLSFAFTQQRK